MGYLALLIRSALGWHRLINGWHWSTMLDKTRHGPLPKTRTVASWPCYCNTLRVVGEIASIPHLLLSWDLFTLSSNLFVLRRILSAERRMLNFWRWPVIDNFYVTWGDTLLCYVAYLLEIFCLWSYFTASWLLFDPEYPQKTNIPFKCLACLLKHAK